MSMRPLITGGDRSGTRVTPTTANLHRTAHHRQQEDA